MSSNSRSLEAQQQLTFPTNDLREQIISLDTETRNLRAEKARLEVRLASLQKTITTNVNAIRVKMKEIDKGLFVEQRAERQLAFPQGILTNDNIIEGLSLQMKRDTGLKIALYAVANGQGTIENQNKFAAALMTELAGETSQFFQSIAAKVLEFHGNSAEDQLYLPRGPTAKPAGVVNDPDAVESIEHQPTQNVKPLIPLVPYGSPSVKSEADSTIEPFDAHPEPSAEVALRMYQANADLATPSPQPEVPNKTTPAMYAPLAVPRKTTPSMYAPLLTMRKTTPQVYDPLSERHACGPPAASPPKVQAPAISRLGKNFPGLLESIAIGKNKKRALPEPEAAVSTEPEDKNGGRQGTPAKQIKRIKTTREPGKQNTNTSHHLAIVR